VLARSFFFLLGEELLATKVHEYLGFLGQGFCVRVSVSGLLGHFTQNTLDDTYRNTLEMSNSERLMVWVWRSGLLPGLLKKLPHFWVSRIGAAFLVQHPPEHALLIRNNTRACSQSLRIVCWAPRLRSCTASSSGAPSPRV
jgi:hypothetical protein